jgi:hypothetical protein
VGHRLEGPETDRLSSAVTPQATLSHYQIAKESTSDSLASTLAFVAETSRKLFAGSTNGDRRWRAGPN